MIIFSSRILLSYVVLFCIISVKSSRSTSASNQIHRFLATSSKFCNNCTLGSSPIAPNARYVSRNSHIHSRYRLILHQISISGIGISKLDCQGLLFVGVLTANGRTGKMTRPPSARKQNLFIGTCQIQLFETPPHIVILAHLGLQRSNSDWICIFSIAANKITIKELYTERQIVL